MNIFLLAILTLLSNLIFYLLFKAIEHVNFPEDRRYKQVVFLLPAGVLLVASTVLYPRAMDLYRLFTGLAPVQSVLSALNAGVRYNFIAYMFFAMLLNLIPGLLYLAVKALLARFSASKYEYEGGGFYHSFLDWCLVFFYDPDIYPPLISKRWILVRKVLKRFITILSVFISLLLYLPLLSTISRTGYVNLFSFAGSIYPLPFVSLIVLAEFVYFLYGPADRVFSEGFGFDQTGQSVVSDYSGLAARYKNQFADHFVTEIVQVDQNDLNEMQMDGLKRVPTENPETAEIMTQFLKRQKEDPEFLFNRYLFKMLTQLYDGKSVAVNASLYDDAERYLLDYMSFQINKGSSVLILAQSTEDGYVIRDFIRERVYDHLELLTNGKVWNIQVLDDAYGEEGIDILIATEQLGVIHVPTILDKYFDRLEVVLVCDSVEYLSDSSFLPMMLGWKLRYRLKRNLQYVFLMEECTVNAVDQFRHIFHAQNITLVNNVPVIKGENYLQLWRSEGPERMQDEWLARQNQNCYGSLFTLAAYGASRGVRQALILADEQVSYDEALNNLTADGQSFEDYQKISDGVTVGKVREVIAGQSFICTYDYMNNLPLMAEKLGNLTGSESTLHHIVSRPYLLRDYFYSLGEAMSEQKYQFLLIPTIDESEQNVIYNCLFKAHNAFITEKELENEVGRFVYSDGESGSTQNLLGACLDRVGMRDKTDPTIIMHCFSFDRVRLFDPAVKKYSDSCRIRLIDDDLYQSVLKGIVRARLDILNQTDYMKLDLLVSQIVQNYLPGQILVYRGVNYLIDDIDLQRGVLKVRHTSFEREVPLYVQDRIYSFVSEDCRLIDALDTEMSDSIGNGLKRCRRVLFETMVRTKVNGYFEFTSAPVLKQDEIYHPVSTDYFDRTTVHTRCLYLGYDIPGCAETDSLAFTAAVLIQEALKTLFPKLSQYLSVVPIVTREIWDDDPETGSELRQLYPVCERWLDNEQISRQGDYNVQLVIIEDTEINVGAVDSLFLNIGMVYKVLNQYLGWYLAQGEDVPGYLKYGRDKESVLFDLPAYASLAAKLNSLNLKPTAVKDPAEDAADCQICSFCGKEITDVEYYTYTDGRVSCQTCRETAVNDETALIRLYRDARRYFKQGYQMESDELNRSIHVMFKDAKAIRRQTGETPPGSRVLGFAYRRKNELWVETGAPEMNIRTVLAHELTHFWQYQNLNMNNPELTLPWIEGHASYIGLEYYRFLGNRYSYEREKKQLLARDDEYGTGYRMLCAGMEQEGIENPFEYMRKHFA